MQEWYLMNTNHDMVSGFERDDFDNFAGDAFSEVLDSSLADDVEICNYDLSQRMSTRVIMVGNVQDTELNSTQRKMLATIGTCEAGMYVYYKGRYWIITGLVDNNKLYEKAVLSLCNYLLTWQDEQGKIVQRWVSITSASQYNNGETSDLFKFVRSDQLMIVTPFDDECIMIPHRHRFVIDSRCKIYEKGFDESVTEDTSKPLLTYKLTRIDNVIFNYQNSGHSEFMATQDEQHDDDGYYVINGKGYWLCGNSSESDDNKSGVSLCKIECDDPILYCDLEPCVCTARFYDENGDVADIVPTWRINCDFVDELNIEYVENSILISVTDKKLVGKSFEINLSADGYEPDSKDIQIQFFL